MTTHYWKGHATAIAQVTTITVGGTVGNETFTVSVGDVDLTNVAGSSDTATDIALALSDLWNNSTHPYHTSITASNAGGVVTLTSDIAGVPFVISTSATGSATMTVNTTTPGSGPNDWTTASNWSSGSVPGDGDVVIFDHSSVPVYFGLDQSAVTLSALHVKQSYTGKIGLNPSVFAVDADTTDTTVSEYRETYLRVGASAIHVGEHTGASSPTGSGRIKLDTGSVQTTLHIHNTASASSDLHHPVVRWMGTHVDNVIYAMRGQVGIASELANQTATIDILYVGQSSGQTSDANVILSEGVTLTDLHQAGGTVMLACDVDMLDQTGGMLYTQGTLTMTDVIVSGKADFQHQGNIANLTLRHGGEADLSHQPQARVISNCTLHHASTMNLNNGNPLSISFTNGIDCVQTSPEDVTITWWPNVKLNVSAIE